MDTLPSLFHYSHDRNIRQFEPRSHKARISEEPRVWAIDHAHVPLYFFPRSCPRAAFWVMGATTPGEVAEFRGQTDARIVLAMEWAWLEQLQNTALYEYELPPDAFAPLNPPGSPEAHGVYVSRETVTPVAVRPAGDLLARFAQRPDVELRLTPSLWPLYDRLLQTTLHYSFIRFANALPRPKGEATAGCQKELPTP